MVFVLCSGEAELLQPLPQRCAQAIHHHDTGQDRDKNRGLFDNGQTTEGERSIQSRHYGRQQCPARLKLENKIPSDDS